MFWSGTTTLIIYKEKMIDIMKIITSLRESSSLIKGVSQIIKNKAKEKRGEFIGMLLGTLGSSLLEIY